MLWLHDTIVIDCEMQTDACLSGGGATCGSEYIHFCFPQWVLTETNHIAQLELFTIVVAVKRWCDGLAGKVIRISSDNESSVWAINRGKCKDVFMLKCLRELVGVCGNNDILLKAKFLPGVLNILPDLLSRWYQGGEHRRKFHSITYNTMKRRSITNTQLTFIYD